MAKDLNLLGQLVPSMDGGSNYALGGATAIGRGSVDFLPQIGTFNRSTPVADPDALYVIWIGFNDIILYANMPDRQLIADRMVENIGAGIQSIRQAGGRHFLVPNVWDTTTLPATRFRDPSDSLNLLDLHLLFNESLSTMLDTFPDPIHRFDAFGLSREIFNDPSRFGFADRLEICPADATNCEGFIWKDLVHATSVAHRILADRALVAIPEPSAALLLGLELVGLRTMRKWALLPWSAKFIALTPRSAISAASTAKVEAESDGSGTIPCENFNATAFVVPEKSSQLLYKRYDR